MEQNYSLKFTVSNEERGTAGTVFILAGGGKKVRRVISNLELEKHHDPVKLREGVMADLFGLFGRELAKDV